MIESYIYFKNGPLRGKSAKVQFDSFRVADRLSIENRVYRVIPGPVAETLEKTQRAHKNLSLTVELDRMNIYVASSWRNILQPAVVSILRGAGHEVYDFRNPEPGNNGFSWREINPEWESWSPTEYREALKHPIAKGGYALDKAALDNCDTCLLVLPSGRSASWEFGYAMGRGKLGAVLMIDKCEPELMYLGSPILTSIDELMDWAGVE